MAGAYEANPEVDTALPVACAEPVFAATGSAADPASVATGFTEGEVRKVDKEAGKLTLRHAEIKSLDMPPMVMVFQVTDAAVLDRLKAGDKVRFKAVNDAGKLVVVEIQPAR